MNHAQQYHYKGMDPDLDEYLSEYKNQTPMESDDYAGKSSIIYMQCFSFSSTSLKTHKECVIMQSP